MRRNFGRRKNSVRIFSAITLFAALIFVASYYFIHQREKGVVVAKVNGQEILQSELELKLRSIFDETGGGTKLPAIANLPKEVLDILIKETYLDKKLSGLAKKSNLAHSAPIEAKIASAQDRILRQAYIDSVVTKDVTDKKIADKYAEISSALAGKKEYFVFHIVVKSKAEAEKLRGMITAKGKAIKFFDVAKKYSLDSESAEKGGELGFVLEDNMIKEVGEEIVKLQKDEISKPIETRFGWHLVKFTDVRDAQPLSFEAVKDNIRQQLSQDRINEIESEIVRNAKVKILIQTRELAPTRQSNEEAKKAK